MGHIAWLHEVKKREDALLKDLKDLLAIPSVRDNQTADKSHPNGLGPTQALEWLLHTSRKYGFETKSKGGLVGYIQFGGQKDSSQEGYIAVLSHVDVVPSGEGWTTDPFQATIKNGKLYARGILDDKGPTIAALYALIVIKELGLQMKHKVRLIFGAAEETGMACMDIYNQDEPAPYAGFTPDADFPIVNAEKGQINCKINFLSDDQAAYCTSVPKNFVQIKLFHSGQTTNMVPDLAEAILIGTEEKLREIMNQYQSFCMFHKLEGHVDLANEELTVRMQGISVHALAPEKGKNAGFCLLEFLNILPLEAADLHFVRSVSKLVVSDPFGEKLNIECQDETMGPLTVNVGILRYWPAEKEAFCQLNIRHPASISAETILQRVKFHSGQQKATVTKLRISPPHVVPAHHPLIEILQDVYTRHTGQAASLLSTGGGTYASKLKNCVAFGPLFPDEIDTAHQPNESLAIDSLLRAAAIYAEAIFKLANTNYKEQELGDPQK